MRTSLIITGFLLLISTGAAQWKAGQPFTDTRDGQVYKTVVIGTQVWMAENLNIGTLVRSTMAGAQMSDNSIIEKYCWDNELGNCDGSGGAMKRGGFYEWQEAVQYWKGQPALPVRGICPEGWHLPSNQEWNVLLALMGGSAAYSRLLAGGGSGFDALLTGYRCTMSGTFRVSAMSSDTRTYFWTAEQKDADNVSFLEIGQSSITAIPFLKSVGLCVRCILDAAASETGQLPAGEDFDIESVTIDGSKALVMKFSAPAASYVIAVHDLLGNMLLSASCDAHQGTNLWHTDVSRWASGIYFIRVMKGNEVRTHKFVIER
jgi:uncharacterized protein (TIGR02145 family)